MKLEHFHNIFIVEVLQNNNIEKNISTNQIYCLSFLTNKGKYDFYYLENENDDISEKEKHGLKNNFEDIKKNLISKTIKEVNTKEKFNLRKKEGEFSLIFTFTDGSEYTINYYNSMSDIVNNNKYLMQLFHKFTPIENFI